MSVQQPLVAGQEVSLGGYPNDWLQVVRVDGTRLQVRRRFGDPVGASSGFWIDVQLVRQARWPFQPQ